MVTSTKNTSLRSLLVIPSVWKRYTVIFHSCLKEWRLKNARNVSAILWQENYVAHTKPLEQVWNCRLVLEKKHTVIEFNQEASLQFYIDMNTEWRKKAKNDFEKDFLNLMNNTVFGKTMENVRNHRSIKLVTIDK